MAATNATTHEVIVKAGAFADVLGQVQHVDLPRGPLLPHRVGALRVILVVLGFLIICLGICLVALTDPE